MKAKQLLALAGLGFALILGACHKEEDVPTAFDIVRTTYPSVSGGGEGLIQLNESGFQIATDVDWLTATAKGDRDVIVRLTTNDTPYERVGNVILTKGSIVHRVPITQLGKVDDAPTLANQVLGSGAQEVEFATSFASEVSVTIDSSVDWLTYQYADGKLKLSAQALPTGTRYRTTEVVVSAGLFKKTITVDQGTVNGYSDIAGEYTLSFVDLDGNAVTADATITNGTDNSLVLSSSKLPLSVKLYYEVEERTVVLPPQELTKPADATATAKYLLIAIKEKGKQLQQGSEYGFVAPLSKSETQIVLSFSPLQAQFDALAFAVYDSSRYKFYSSSGTYKALSSIVLTKK